MSLDPEIRKQLRVELRSRRRTLSPTQQAQASILALRHLMSIPEFMRARHVALYIAHDGEVDPAPIAAQLWKMGKQCYLPVVRPGKTPLLWFVDYTADSLLVTNRFGIPEPDHRNTHKLPPNLLDVALLPLVGFDRQGLRLGMGGGFYDATFAFKQQKKAGRPYLLGLAHSCQETDKLTKADWDIPLFGIVTEKEFIKA